MTLAKNDQRRVLLIDHDSRRQQLRAAALRNCEVEVHPASNIEDALRLCARLSYDMVLLAAEESSEEAATLSDELKKSRPRQRVALLVGAPEYIREMRRATAVCVAATKQLPLPLAISAHRSAPSQWQVTLEHLLAAG